MAQNQILSVLGYAAFAIGLLALPFCVVHWPIYIVRMRPRADRAIPRTFFPKSVVLFDVRTWDEYPHRD